MPDYENMSWLEALQYAKEISGLTAEEIASRMFVKPSVVRRYLKNDGGYAPGLDKIPLLCLAMNNGVLLNWIEAQIRICSISIPPAKDRAEVLTAVAEASAALGDVQRRLVETAETGIDPVCARELRSLLEDVILVCQRCQLMLHTLAQKRYRTDCEPLCSLADPKKQRIPWWKFWKR
ncbi:MAG TPA: helix-turn-helix domain-containing protein [Candidatus Desulfovibrio intestinigallinarum]|nr:helix-turn-helix domain-containing protein [Candidatus Desulfovibrio intestinigallinarum]